MSDWFKDLFGWQQLLGYVLVVTGFFSFVWFLGPYLVH